MERCQAVLGTQDTGHLIHCTGVATARTTKDGRYIHLCRFCAARAAHRLKAEHEPRYQWARQEEPEVRWPSKPEADAHCDAMVGSRTDRHGAPVLIRCPNKATETVMTSFTQAWVCTSCAEAMERNNRCKRNPKRKK